MLISQKCQYGLRAIFELSRRSGQGPVKIAQIAKAQVIPVRFLEVILSQLKQGGFVVSHRGNKGGYTLSGSPAGLTVGDVIRFLQGPMGPVDCLAVGSREKCRLYGNCAFLPMWEKVHEAISDVYDNTTFQDLLEQEMQHSKKTVTDYCI